MLARQQGLFELGPAAASNGNGENNRLREDDRSFHDWYRFVLSFPPHLVDQYLDAFSVRAGGTVLDPFCGTGTTLVECKKLGIASIGVESNPMASFASRIKTTWDLDPESLEDGALEIAARCRATLRSEGIEDGVAPCSASPEPDKPQMRGLSEERMRLLLKDSISPLPLHKTLALLDAIDASADPCYVDHLRLALANAVVSTISNLKFGPEVGVGKLKVDAPVIDSWLNVVRRMVSDIRQDTTARLKAVPSRVIQGDARDLESLLQPCSIDAVITSPPYPNEKDYTRTTRLESVLLGLVKSKDDLRQVKRSLIRSNTRGVYKSDVDDEVVAANPEIQRIAEEIESRRIAMGKTSGFERLYARVTKLYFGGMARHLRELRTALRPGAQLAYVVGDQASYLRVMIRTGEILAGIAEAEGYEVVKIDLFRTRMATATRDQLREEVVCLRWPG